MADVRHLAFLKFHIGHMTVIEFKICYCVPNVIKIEWFFVEMWRFNNFQDGGWWTSAIL